VLVIPADGAVTDEHLQKTPRWRRWMPRLARWIGGCAPPPPSPPPTSEGAARAPRAWTRLLAGCRDGRFLSRLADLYPRIDAHFDATDGAPRRRILGG